MHRLGKSEKTIVKFLSGKDAQNLLVKKKKFRYSAISKIFTDDTEVRSNQFTEIQNGRRKVISESLPILQVPLWSS